MSERKTQVLDLTVTIIIFVIASFVGKAAMDSYHTWTSFNVPAIGLLVVGELLWWRIRKKLVDKNESNKT